MSQAMETKNKALVLEAFDTLFNKRDYAGASVIGPLTTSSTALKLNPAEKDFSISSRAFHPRFGMNRERLSARVTS
jgi:hypothetical protein